MPKHHRSFTRFHGKTAYIRVLFITLFVTVASVFLLAARAGTQLMNTIEPEEGATSSASLSVNDATLSNGGYVLFNGCGAGKTGTPPNCSAGTLEIGVPPFSAQSPWNTPISSAQQSKWKDVPILRTLADNSQSRKLYFANTQLKVWHGLSSDPEWTITMPEFGSDNQTFNRHWMPATFKMRAPQDIAQGEDSDQILAIIDETTGNYFESWAGVVIDGNNHTIVGPPGSGWARGNTRTDIGMGTLLASGGNSAGVRAANFSWIGGAITGYDIQQVLDGKKTDFGHALVMALGWDTLSNWEVTWPATAPDNGGHSGPIKMGTRVGIPATVARPSQISASDKMGVALFNTLQKYGIFVGDFAGTQWQMVYMDGNTVKDGSPEKTAIDATWIWWEGSTPRANELITPLLRVMEGQ